MSVIVIKSSYCFDTRMSFRATVSLTVLFALLDVIITTVLYTHGSVFSIFSEDLLNFNIMLSALDMWGLVLVRASILLGASVGVTVNRRDGPQRVAKLTTVLHFLSLIIVSYCMAKLLMLIELVSLKHQPWFLSLICWTCASCLGVLLLWGQLGKESHSANQGCGGSKRDEGGAEDTERLVDTAGEEEPEVGYEGRKKKEGQEEKDKTSTEATLRRLLSYCKKDGGLLAVAVLFLAVSAVCKCPSKVYTNQSISVSFSKNHVYVDVFLDFI